MLAGEQMRQPVVVSEPSAPLLKERISTRSWSIIAAIVLLLIYQGYTLSVSGIAAPGLAKVST
jgi:hypothetical protein